MALTTGWFWMRFVNEVTRASGSPVHQYDIQRCIAPCVDTVVRPRSKAVRSR